MDQYNQIVEALHLRNWYALAAIVLTLLVQLIKTAPKLQPLWQLIPNGWRWAIPVVSGAVTGFTQAYAANLPLGAAIIAAVGGAIGISIPAMGINAVLTESPFKWNGGAGGEPLAQKLPKDPKLPPMFPGAGALLLVIAAFHSTACAPKSAADVPHDVAIAYAAANAALEVADSAEAAYLDSLSSPTQDQIDSATAIVDKLKQARATLIKVHDDLKNGREKLVDALSDLRSAVELASALGVKVPPRVDQALTSATEALR